MKGRVDTRDELLTGILNAAARIKKHEDKLRRTTRDPHSRVTKCIETGSGIFEHLLLTVTKFSLLCNKFAI
jgi:hypothetical protein